MTTPYILSSVCFSAVQQSDSFFFFFFLCPFHVTLVLVCPEPALIQGQCWVLPLNLWIFTCHMILLPYSSHFHPLLSGTSYRSGPAERGCSFYSVAFYLLGLAPFQATVFHVLPFLSAISSFWWHTHLLVGAAVSFSLLLSRVVVVIKLLFPAAADFVAQVATAVAVSTSCCCCLIVSNSVACCCRCW